jgi:hypothetical protein
MANERRTANDEHITSRQQNTYAGFHPFLKPLRNQSVGIEGTKPEGSQYEMKIALFENAGYHAALKSSEPLSQTGARPGQKRQKSARSSVRTVVLKKKETH